MVSWRSRASTSAVDRFRRFAGDHDGGSGDHRDTCDGEAWGIQQGRAWVVTVRASRERRELFSYIQVTSAEPELLSAVTLARLRQ